MILTAVFAQKVGLIFGHTATLIAHIIGLGVVSALAFGGSYLLYTITDWITPLRVTEEQEIIGLDLSQHGETISEQFQLGEINIERKLKELLTQEN